MTAMVKVPRVGRPPMITTEMQRAILELLAEGNSLRQICELEGMPSKQAVFSHFVTHKEFLDLYSRVREVHADQIYDELEDLTRESMDCTDPVKVNAIRLFVDTQKWRLARMYPKKYGDRQIIQGDKDADPIQHSLAARLDSASKALRQIEPPTIDAEFKPVEDSDNDSSNNHE